MSSAIQKTVVEKIVRADKTYYRLSLDYAPGSTSPNAEFSIHPNTKLVDPISVGSTVGVNARTEYWLGTVTKVMKTRCAVKNMNNGMRYAVPLSLIDVKKVA